MKGFFATASAILLFGALLEVNAAAVLQRSANNAPPFANTAYLIRNAESFGDGNGGGLEAVGDTRASCLKNVFGAQSSMPVGYIIAERAKEGSSFSDQVDTVTPLAQSLGLNVDFSCGRDDKDCVLAAMTNFANQSSASILVCWEVQYLEDIAEELGASNIPNFPGGSFDTIWTVQNNTLTVSSENCAGIDN